MTTKQQTEIKNMLSDWGNFHNLLRLYKNEVDQLLPLYDELKKNNKQADTLPDDINEASASALKYCRKRINRIESILKETKDMKIKLDEIIDNMDVAEKTVLYTRYVKKQEWATMYHTLPFAASRSTVIRLHNQALEHIFEKYYK